MIFPLMFLSFGRPGIWELLLVLFIILLLFGAKRLPALARSLGKAIQELRNARSENDQSSGPDSTPPEQPS